MKDSTESPATFRAPLDVRRLLARVEKQTGANKSKAICRAIRIAYAEHATDLDRDAAPQDYELARAMALQCKAAELKAEVEHIAALLAAERAKTAKLLAR